MKKVFTELKNYELLSREQLKHIGGNVVVNPSGGDEFISEGSGVYSCKCRNHAGSWIGRYKSDSQADQAVHRHCERGRGYCIEIM